MVMAHTLMLIVACSAALIIELLPQLLQQLIQPVVWLRDHPAMRVIHVYGSGTRVGIRSGFDK